MTELGRQIGERAQAAATPHAAQVGDTIARGPIPANVTEVKDAPGPGQSLHVLGPSGLWHMSGVEDDSRPWPIEDVLDCWGPLTVTKVREPEHAAEPTPAERSHAVMIASGCCGMLAVHTADCPKYDAAEQRAAVHRYATEPQPEADVLDLVRQLADESYRGGVLDRTGDDPNGQKSADSARALRAQIEAEVQRLRDELLVTGAQLLHEGNVHLSTVEKLARERNEALTEVESLKVESEKRLDALIKTRTEREELRAEVERLKSEIETQAGNFLAATNKLIAERELAKLDAPQQDGPLVLRLPEVPEGAVALVGVESGRRAVRHPSIRNVWVLAEDINLPEAYCFPVGAFLNDEGSVTVEMAPPPEPRTAVQVWADATALERGSLGDSSRWSELAEALDREAGL